MGLFSSSKRTTQTTNQTTITDSYNTTQAVSSNDNFSKTFTLSFNEAGGDIYSSTGPTNPLSFSTFIPIALISIAAFVVWKILKR
jgi:hypothetical protein